jgi:hypothetical protein
MIEASLRRRLLLRQMLFLLGLRRDDDHRAATRFALKPNAVSSDANRMEYFMLLPS